MGNWGQDFGEDILRKESGVRGPFPQEVGGV